MEKIPRKNTESLKKSERENDGGCYEYCYELLGQKVQVQSYFTNEATIEFEITEIFGVPPSLYCRLESEKRHLRCLIIPYHAVLYSLLEGVPIDPNKYKQYN